MLAVCDDEAVIGSPFYVMELVEGDVITAELPAPLDTPAERRRIGEELVDALVELHAVDWRAAGLEGFGKPTGYLERQVRRFPGLWEHNRTREIEAVETRRRLAGRPTCPSSPAATVVHGDFRLGNTMFAPGAPARLVAIFDWEMATIGDPLADLGYLCTMWSRPTTRRGGMFDLTAVTRERGLPDARGARRPLRGGLGPLDDRRPLVHGAGHVEGRSSSWRATTSARWPAPPTTRT